MSSIKRVFSGSAAAWVRILIAFASQILLVPVFLSHWEPHVYGIWLATLAFSSLITFIDIGHHNFLGYEFLKLGDKKPYEISKIYYSSIPIATGISILEIIIILIIIFFDLHVILFAAPDNTNPDIYDQAAALLLLNAIIWLIIGNWSTIAGRALAPFGYFPRIAWWQVLGAAITSISTAISVSMGGSLLIVGFAYQSAYILYAIPVLLDILRLLKKEKILPVFPNYKLGAINLQKSLAISFKAVLDMLRQQHVRLIVAPLAGTVQMVTFVTIRTGANIMLQGIGTITNPLMPELMRFLRDKDEERSKVAISLVWLILVSILIPGTILAQWLMPEIFSVWTRGKIKFDPILFALLSFGVLIFTLTQPALAVVQGNNLLKPQIWISIFVTGTAFLGMFSLMPLLGINGVGLALLLAEFMAFLGYLYFALHWFNEKKMSWPNKSLWISSFSVMFAGLTMIALILWPPFNFAIVCIGMLISLFFVILYWTTIPDIGRTRFKLPIR